MLFIKLGARVHATRNDRPRNKKLGAESMWWLDSTPAGCCCRRRRFILFFFWPFLICRLFAVKTVHSAKLRAFYGARRYFPLQFHYFRARVFFFCCSFKQKSKTAENDANCGRGRRWTQVMPFNRPAEREREQQSVQTYPEYARLTKNIIFTDG